MFTSSEFFIFFTVLFYVCSIFIAGAGLVTSANRFWKAEIVHCVNATITRIYVIEKVEAVWRIVKIIPQDGIVNDVKMVHTGTPQNNSAEVSVVIGHPVMIIKVGSVAVFQCSNRLKYVTELD